MWQVLLSEGIRCLSHPPISHFRIKISTSKTQVYPIKSSQHPTAVSDGPVRDSDI